MVRPRRAQLQIEPNGSNPVQTSGLVPILSTELKTRAESWLRELGFREYTKALAGNFVAVKGGNGHCVRTIALKISRSRRSPGRERFIENLHPHGRRTILIGRNMFAL